MSNRYDYRQRKIGENYYARRPVKKKSRGLRSLFFLVILVFVIALFIYVFPEVEVTLVPETEALNNSFEVQINGNLEQADRVNNRFPGEIIIVEESESKVFAATGEKNVGEKAQGEVVFFNQTGLTQPLTTENSLVTDDGVVFYLKNNVEIPKAEVSAEGSIVYGNISAGIIAAEAGEEGNISPGRLTIIDLAFSKQNKIYGEVQNKLSGGTSKVIRVVSGEDLAKAEKELTDRLKPALRDKANERLVEGQSLNDELIEYEMVGVEKAVELEEEIDEFSMEVKARARALVWNVAEVKEMILQKIKDGITSDKQLVESSQDVFEIGVEDFNLEGGTADLKIETRNQISLPIEINALKDELKGLTEFEARRLLLAKDNIKDVRFKFSYSITSKIPENGNRINIKLNF